MNKIKLLIYLITFLIFFTSVSAFINETKIEIYNPNAWIIESQDYMQEYIDYKIDPINLTHYKLRWKLKDIDKFQTIKTDTINYKEIKETSDLKQKDAVKEAELEQKIIQEVEKLSTDKKTITKEQYIQDMERLSIQKSFPVKEAINTELLGAVNPIDYTEGELIVIIKDLRQPATFSIGFGTITTSFSNGYSSEQFDFYYTDGIKNDNYIRYFAVPITTRVDGSYINTTGIESKYTPYIPYDLFYDNIIDTDKWQTTYTNYDASCNYIMEIGTSPELSYVELLSRGQRFGVGSSCYYFGTRSIIHTQKETSFWNSSILIKYDWDYEAGSTSIDLASVYLYAYNGSNYQALSSGQKDSSTSTGSGSESKNYKIIHNEQYHQYYFYYPNGAFSHNITDTLRGNNRYISASTSITVGMSNANTQSRLRMYWLGISNNYDEFISWNNTQVTYPQNTIINVSTSTIFTNATEYNTSSIIYMTTGLNNAISNGACNCEGCSIIMQTCFIPFSIYSDYGGSLLINNISIITEIDYNITLIDEATGQEFNVSNLSIAKVYNDINQVVYNFKENNNASSYAFAGDAGQKFRFVFGYYDETIPLVTRYIDSALIEDGQIRLCVNTDEVEHVLQYVQSKRPKPVYFRSIYADCYIGADNTRFAFSDYVILRAYTTDRPYEITSTDLSGNFVSLAGFDGSISTTINLDTLAYNMRQYDISTTRDEAVFEKVSGSNTIKIAYYNQRNDSIRVNLTITNMDNNIVVYSKNDFTDPNNFIVLFDYTTIANITNTTIFQLNIRKTDSFDNVGTYTRYFNINLGTGILSSPLIAIVTIFFCIAGITNVPSRSGLSWFGIFILLVGLGLSTMAISTWYIKFIQAIIVFEMLFIGSVLATTGGEETIR